MKRSNTETDNNNNIEEKSKKKQRLEKSIHHIESSIYKLVQDIEIMIGMFILNIEVNLFSERIIYKEISWINNITFNLTNRQRWKILVNYEKHKYLNIKTHWKNDIRKTINVIYDELRTEHSKEIYMRELKYIEKEETYAFIAVYKYWLFKQINF